MLGSWTVTCRTGGFVKARIEEALRRAREAAGPRDVRLVGGVETPVALGSGEHLLHGLDLPALGYRISEHVPSGNATHVVFTRD